MSARRRFTARCAVVALPLLLLCLGNNAGAQERPHRFATLALWDPISTNADREATTNLRLALVQSYVHSVRGLDITGVASQLGGDLHGVQLTGVYSHVGGGGRGLLAAGFASHVQGAFTGGQATLVMNYNRDHFRGVQWSGLLNFTSGGFSGLQWAGTLNMNDSGGTGWQLSSAANVNNGRFTGLQTSLFFNFVNVGATGVQVSGLNWARHLKGGQVGLMNISGDVRGTQVGVLNLSEQNAGVPVGLINIAQNGSEDWMTWGSSYMGVETGLRTIVNSWYSILSVGGLYTPDSDLTAWSVGWNYGYRFGLSPRLSLSVDAGFRHVMPEKDPGLNDRLRPAVQGRAFLEYAVDDLVAIHAGAGGNQEWSEYSSGAETEFDQLFFGGVSLFGGVAR